MGAIRDQRVERNITLACQLIGAKKKPAADLAVSSAGMSVNVNVGMKCIYTASRLQEKRYRNTISGSDHDIPYAQTLRQ
jgi:hypothetical protein